MGALIKQSWLWISLFTWLWILLKSVVKDLNNQPVVLHILATQCSKFWEQKLVGSELHLQWTVDFPSSSGVFVSRCGVEVCEGGWFRRSNLVLTKSRSLYTEAQSSLTRACSFSFYFFFITKHWSTFQQDNDGNSQKHQCVALRT